MILNKDVRALALGALTLLLCAAGPLAAQECLIEGHISAAASSDDELPAWTYTLTLTWDSGSNYALSHFDLLIDEADANCECTELMDAISLPDVAGQSDTETADCYVDYNAFFECDGDPSIPGVTGELIKFEPLADDCEPGATGSGTFTFYSDLPPVPVNENILALVDKAGQTSCYGQLTGVFPALACDPVGNEAQTWGTVKSLYRN